MMAGILKIVRYSVGEMRPMAATALPALDSSTGSVDAACYRVARDGGGLAWLAAAKAQGA